MGGSYTYRELCGPNRIIEVLPRNRRYNNPSFVKTSTKLSMSSSVYGC